MTYQETLTKIKDAIEADLKGEEESIAMFEELSKLFERYEGKRITKRMATAIEKEHPDWTVYYKPDYGTYQINIWGGDSGRDYNN